MNFDKPFRDKLQDHEETPTHDIWAKLSERLDAEQKPTKHRTIGFYRYAVAASIALFIATGGLWYGGRQGINLENQSAYTPIKIEKEDFKNAIAFKDTTSHTKKQPNTLPNTPSKDSKKQPETKTKPKQERPKMIPALPARTELIARQSFKTVVPPLQDYEDTEDMLPPFREVQVKVSFKPLKAAAKSKRKRFMASKNRENGRENAPKLKILGLALYK